MNNNQAIDNRYTTRTSMLKCHFFLDQMLFWNLSHWSQIDNKTKHSSNQVHMVYKNNMIERFTIFLDPPLVDCPTQLTLYDLDLSVVFHDKYQWEIWKNTAGKSASFNVTLPKQMNFRKSSNWPIFFLNNHNWSAATRECRLSWAWAWKWLLFA